MKELVKREIKKWFKKVVKSIKKYPFQKIVLIVISPFLIHAMAEALLDFGLLTTIGYYVACIYGFSKILDDPYRIVKWGGGYAIGASVIPLILSTIIPEIQKGTFESVFSILIISYAALMIWLKSIELKRS